MTVRIAFCKSLSREELPTIISNSPGSTKYSMAKSWNARDSEVMSSATVSVSPGSKENLFEAFQFLDRARD